MNASPLLDLIDQYQMIPKKSTLFLGVSGGADSIYLLHRLYELQNMLDFTLMALHFNHQLRGEESHRDEAFVRQFVAEFCPSIPLIVDTAPVAQLAAAEKRGLEEMARICRYDFFQRCANNVENSRIATAHTADDNGETVLMNLTRGTGLRGLSGIPPVRGNIIRPLLTTTREEIEGYLALHCLPHVEDSSNSDLSYTRNRLRHQVMPVLTEQNPGFLQNISALTPILREEEEILEALTAQSLPPLEVSVGRLSLSAVQLAALPRPLALRGVQQMAELLSPQLVLERGHREDILSLCRSDSPSARLDLPLGLTVHRQYDLLVFTTQASAPLEEVTLSLPFAVECSDYRISVDTSVYRGIGSPWDFWISRDYTALTLRPRREGDRLQRPNRSDKTVKSIMIDEKIPRHLRDSLPVFSVDGQVVAVTRLGVNQSALPQIGAEGWHIVITQL